MFIYLLYIFIIYVYLHIETNKERANIHIITGITNEIGLSTEKMAVRRRDIELQDRQR